MNKSILIALIVAFNLSFSMSPYDIGNHKDDFIFDFGEGEEEDSPDMEVLDFAANTPKTPMSEAPTPLKGFFKEVTAQDQSGKQYTLIVDINSTFEDLINALAEMLDVEAEKIGIYTVQEFDQAVPKFVNIHNPNITPKYTKSLI